MKKFSNFEVNENVEEPISTFDKIVSIMENNIDMDDVEYTYCQECGSGDKELTKESLKSTTTMIMELVMKEMVTK
jgi:hypothetical protein